MKTKTKRRVHGGKRHQKTRKGGEFLKKIKQIAETAKSVPNRFKNFLNNPNDYKSNSLSEYEESEIIRKQGIAAERESVAELPLVAPPRGGRKTRDKRIRSHRRR